MSVHKFAAVNDSPSLEEEIQQTRFKDQYQKGIINLMYTTGQIHSAQNRFLKAYDITIPQYNILRILRGQHPQPATVSLLIARMLDKTSNASRIVERLRRKGLVSRVRRESDRRQVDVEITPRGLDLLAELDQHESALACGMHDLDVLEIEEFNRLLDKLRGALYRAQSAENTL